MMKKTYIYPVMSLLLLTACSEDVLQPELKNPDISNGEVRINAEIDQVNITRADDSGFADGDVIGVFAVDFENGQPGQLRTSGNNSDNIDFKFDEKAYRWSGSQSIRFKDNNTPLDLYGYYPYRKEVTDVNRYPISVDYNQSGDSADGKMSAYEASDFLWAKSSGLTFANPNATLCFKHTLASVRVTLTEGTGFAEDEWAGLDKFVSVCNTCRSAYMDLATGTVTPTGEKDNRDIVARQDRGDFRAIVIPQSVKTGEVLMTITVDKHNYKFIKEVKMEYLQGKQHNFTIEVTKSNNNGDYEFTLVDESITAWESDLISHNGEAKEYILINLQKTGSLKTAIEEKGFNPKEIINLKLTGPMNDDDFQYLRESITNLEAINMLEVDLASMNDIFYNYAIPRKAFSGMKSLRTCVFPKKLKMIGGKSFQTTSLRGNLEIPEGVVEIEENAFGSENQTNCLTGELKLPSSLKKIGDFAFQCCDFTGSLMLPEGIEQIGQEAFAGCSNFTGELHLPSSIKQLGGGAFNGMSGITGWIELPSDLTYVEGFSKMNITGVVWPKKPFGIGVSAFEDTEFKTDLRLPDNVTTLGGASFKEAKIRHIVLPSEITKIPPECFHSSSLQDTIIIPENVIVIESWAFCFCKNLTAIIFPSKLKRICERAFCDCYNVDYIRCDAPEPPQVEEMAFEGIQKDNFTLEVPEGSVEAYRNAPGWCEFKRISAYRNFVARPSKYNVLNKGGRKEIILNADADWEMTDCPSWCHIDKTTGSKKTTLHLTVDAMSKGSDMRSGTITFKLKGSEHLTHINVAQYDYEYGEDQCVTLQKATKGNGIDLVFLGDGYDAADISSGMYLADMKQEMEYFFGVEPYTTYRDYFNVYTGIALSEDSGVESINQWRSTKFSVCLGDGCGKDGQRLSADWASALDYCAETVPSTANRPDPRVGCILVGNTDIYEGVTYMGDSFCAVVTKSDDRYPYDARGIVQHEAGGHGIGWLGDEYIYHQAHIQGCKCRCCKHVSELLADHESGYSLNLSLNGKHKEVPWSHLVFNPSYGDIVDIYEGGYFHSRGVYRSESNSCMNNNVPYFSSWNRQLIVQRIMKLAGESFDLNSFYANDSRATGKDFTSTSRSGSTQDANIPTRHGNAPIRITNYKYGKKGGRR